MKKQMNSPILLTLVAFLANTISAPAMGYETIYSPNEASPEEIAAEFAAEMGFAPPPAETVEVAPRHRVVAPENFDKYRLTVDVFRRGKKKPVLGKWNDEYLDAANATFTARDEKTRIAQGKKRFAILADREFAVVSIDGVPVKVNLISGAREAEVNLPLKINGVTQKEIVRDPSTGEVVLDPETGKPKLRVIMKLSKKTTPNGAFKISPRMTRKVPVGMPANSTPVRMPNPYPLSMSYESTMYWGLEIFNGYLIHSTPHYGELGVPASMGCIRQPYPDAMELFDLVANQFGGEGMIRIHKMDSEGGYNRLRELFYDPSFEPVYTAADLLNPEKMTVYATASSPRDMKWLVERLNIGFQNVKDFIKYNRSGEYDGYGHTWINPTTKRPDEPVFPKCGANDCVSEFGDPSLLFSKVMSKKRAADAEAEEAEEMAELLLLQQAGH